MQIFNIFQCAQNTHTHTHRHVKHAHTKTFLFAPSTTLIVCVQRVRFDSWSGDALHVDRCLEFKVVQRTCRQFYDAIDMVRRQPAWCCVQPKVTYVLSVWVYGNVVRFQAVKIVVFFLWILTRYLEIFALYCSILSFQQPFIYLSENMF